MTIRCTRDPVAHTNPRAVECGCDEDLGPAVSAAHNHPPMCVYVCVCASVCAWVDRHWYARYVGSIAVRLVCSTRKQLR